MEGLSASDPVLSICPNQKCPPESYRARYFGVGNIQIQQTDCTGGTHSQTVVSLKRMRSNLKHKKD